MEGFFTPSCGNGGGVFGWLGPMSDTAVLAAPSPDDATGERWRRVALVVALALAGLGWRFAVYLLTGRTGGPIGFIEAHCVWDCEWYSLLVENGYQREVGIPSQPERANWAFFPLYPMLVAVLVHGLGLTSAIAGFLLSNAMTIAAAVLARPLLETSRAYWFFVATLMVGPFSVLFSSLYSESLFVLLTVLTLRALRQSNYLRAAGWIALLSATRITGVLMLFALATQVIVDHRRQGGRWRDLPGRVLGDRNLLLAIFLAPVGLFAFMAFLWLHMGDALAFSHIQRSWERDLIGPLAAINGVISGGFRFEYQSLLEWSWLLAGLGGLALCYVLRLRGRLPEAVFCSMALLVSLSTGVSSMMRFVAGLAPLGMVTAELLTRWRWLAWLSLAIAIALDAAVTISWFDSAMFIM